MLTDTHCHLDYATFDPDREAVLHRAREAGLVRILVPGLQERSSREAVRLAEADPMLYAAVGFHPTNLEHFSDETWREIVGLAGHPRVVAIGEIGLDYYWVTDERARTVQHEALREHLLLAEQTGKPVVIHLREEGDAWFGQASIDLLQILGEWHDRLRAANHPLAEKPGVLHSFNGTLETAYQALEMNFCLGVTGPVTYRNGDEKRRIIKELPLDRLLIETDSPFLAPVPRRGKRNEPAFVAYIADKIADIHMTTRERVAEITAANAARLFSWEADA